MKNTVLILTAFSILALPFCRKVRNKNTMVVKDCTGTYLRFEGNDYHVCNLEKTASFPDSTFVTASFKKLNECKGSGGSAVVCMMLHENKGWIEVTQISKK